ncbi:MAG: AAA family ATPase [Balneolaceae bacterium]
MPKRKFVNVPEVKSIKVESYPLFNGVFEYNFKKGLNLFIGTNGIGKTTTTHLIIFSLIGNYNNQYGGDFFISRNKLKNDNTGITPKVSLEFSVNNIPFKIVRSIKDSLILHLEINNETIGKEKYEEVYKQEILRYSGFNSFDDIYRIITLFLIREEEGNYLIWDNFGVDQSKVFRVLFTYQGFDKDYENLSKRYTESDTKIRGLQDNRAQFIKRIERLENDKEELISTKKSVQTKRELLEKNGKIEDKILDERSRSLTIKEDLEFLTDHINEYQSEISTLNGVIDENTEKILFIEKDFYDEIYNSEHVLLSLHKLEHYHICFHCNNKIGAARAKSIIQKYRSNECPICDSNLGIDETNKSSPEDISEVEVFKSQILSSKEKIKELETNLESHIIDLDRKQSDLEKLNLTIQNLYVSLRENQMKLNEIIDPKDEVTDFDIQIKTLLKEVKIYDDEINEVIPIRRAILEELTSKNEYLNKSILKYQKDLNEIFKSFTKDYFEGECELVVNDKKPSDFKLRVNSFIPKFEGKARVYSTRCSTSQRLFLEYTFRLSLLQLYCNVSKSSPMLILEPSEGAFDLANTTFLAETFKTASKEINLTVIGNFSKPDFIKSLAKNNQGIKKRFLNYLNFGILSENEKKRMKTYRDVLKNAGLE